jgi:hypothetical protein
MNALNVLLWILMLLVLPTCAGYAACRFLRLPRSIPTCYLGGTFVQWALIQCFSVPMTLLKLGFVPLTWAISVSMGLLAMFGINLFMRDRRSRANRPLKDRIKGWKPEAIFALSALVVAYLYLAWNCARYAHIDLDDARFVVSAVDIESTARLFLTDFGTGMPVADFAGTLRHDLFSPWAVYIAYVGRMTMTSPTVIAHSVLPQALMLAALSAWLLIAQRQFDGRRFEKYGVPFIAILLIMYCGNRGYTAESFFLRRLWQGKAVVASIGIPTMYLVLTRCGHKPEGWRPCLPIYIVALAMCLMSAMGFIICCMLCGAFGLAYGIQGRKITVALKIWGGALICLAYVGVMLLLMT